MKKPVDSKGDNREAPELDEFSKLQQQYDEASTEQRERLWPDLIRAIRKIDPNYLQKFERAFRSGDYLKAQVESAMKRALVRADLRPGGKTNAEEEATAVHFVFNELKREDLRVGEIRELAYELAARTLFIGQWAGPSHNEVENLRVRFMSEYQKKVGAKSGESRRDQPWREFAKKEALRLHNANRALTLSGIARIIEKEWESEDFEKVEQQQLFKYLSETVDKGELPSSMKRRATKR
jgi:hypothetical protein